MRFNNDTCWLVAFAFLTFIAGAVALLLVANIFLLIFFLNVAGWML